MYKAFFGLQKLPFGMTPDPAFLYLTPQHREALAGLSYALLQQKGFLVLTGEAGTGKTTLLAQTLECLPTELIQFSVVLNPTLTCDEFLEMVLMDFGIADIPASKARRLWKLQQLLIANGRCGRISAVVVDEAHKLSPAVLEEIRLLGNFDHADRKLLQILLLGQRELNAVLNREDLRQLKQRVAVRLALQPLSSAEVGDYMRFRWAKAAHASPFPFSAETVDAVFRISNGIPRIINALCDNALLLAFAEAKHLVTVQHVRTAAADLDMADPSARPVASAPPPVEAPSPVAPPPVRQLHRQPSPVDKPSLVARWAGKLGFASMVRGV